MDVNGRKTLALFYYEDCLISSTIWFDQGTYLKGCAGLRGIITDQQKRSSITDKMKIFFVLFLVGATMAEEPAPECKDSHPACHVEWCKEGDYIAEEYCQKTCGACTAVEVLLRSAVNDDKPSLPEPACKDSHPACHVEWCKEGDYIAEEYCQKTCGACTVEVLQRSAADDDKPSPPEPACKDSHPACHVEWCKEGEYIAEEYCQKTCGACTGVEVLLRSAADDDKPSPPEPACKDSHPACHVEWCKEGDYIAEEYCQKTCGACTAVEVLLRSAVDDDKPSPPEPACKDSHPACHVEWCKEGEYIAEEYCQKTCGACTVEVLLRSAVDDDKPSPPEPACKDSHPACHVEWCKEGEYIAEEYCQKTCGACNV